jgi:hypothetical protein
MHDSAQILEWRGVDLKAIHDLSRAPRLGKIGRTMRKDP